MKRIMHEDDRGMRKGGCGDGVTLAILGLENVIQVVTEIRRVFMKDGMLTGFHKKSGGRQGG